MAILILFYQNCGESFSSNSQSSLIANDESATPSVAPTEEPNNQPSGVVIESQTPEIKEFKFLNEIQTLEETTTDCKFIWQLSMSAQSYILYGLDKSSLNLKNIGEISFDYTTHIQSIKNLEPGESYYYKVVAQNKQSQVIESDIQSCQTQSEIEAMAPSPILPENNLSQRDLFWKAKGYTLFYRNTPSKSDFGSTAVSYFKGDWSNDQPILTQAISQKNLEFTAAPDGSPSLKSTLHKGEVQSLNIRGQQLTQANKTRSTVFSYEIWIESIGLTQGYIGAGHYWGSRPGVTHSPGGAKYYDDAFSFRTINTRSRTIAPYLYTSKSSSNGSYGSSPGGKITPPLGRWVLIETEIVLNFPASSANGAVRSFVDGSLSGVQENTQLRNDPDAFMKGFSIFIRDNKGAPFKEVQYFKNWKIYTRP